MRNISSSPFESVRQTAQTFSDPHVQSQLLSELAHIQLSTGQFDAALQTFSTIPLPQERRAALLSADFSHLPTEKVPPLLQLLHVHPQTHLLTGSIALFLLESQNTASAWKLIETAQTPFESQQQQYNFLEKVLPLIEDNDWTKVLHLHQTFTDETYRDWATLALVKYLSGKQRYDEAETFIRSFTLPIRRSRTFWEMCRGTDEPLSEKFFDKAVYEIETVSGESDHEEERERLAVQLRILGRSAIQRGKQEQGEQLLERCEAIIAELTMPMQRCRQQCFLGKVLGELKLIASIQDYVPIESVLQSLSSDIDRSKVLVWLAEAGWNEGWQRAVETLSVPERGVMESERAEQIAGVLKRCVSHHQDLPASGDSAEDVFRISGEEFEVYYFSPFAAADCGC